MNLEEPKDLSCADSATIVNLHSALQRPSHLDPPNSAVPKSRQSFRKEPLPRLAGPTKGASQASQASSEERHGNLQVWMFRDLVPTFG